MSEGTVEKKRISLFRCPECLSELTDLPGHLRCDKCQKQFPVVDGLPVFSRDRDFYYGEVSKDQMQKILARASLVGWHTSILEYADATGTMDFHDYTASPIRAGFKFLLDRFETGTALDYGCGSGAIATSLARNFAKVYAADLTLERVRFTQIRAQQEKLYNVIAFCSGDTPYIPLRDNSVDVIVLNGVLEWVPDHRSGDPRSVQIAFLRELRRILVKNGLLFIGIENRIGFGYVLGKHEEHAGLRFVSLLPRRIANLYSQVMRGRPYRNYTYSRSGYRSLLESGGFPRTDFWGLVPDYRGIEKAIHLSETRMIRESITGETVFKRARNLVIRAFFPWMSESFGVLAGDTPFLSYVARLTSHISDAHLSGTPLEIRRYSVTNTGMVHVRASSDKTDYMIKLPLSARADQRTEAALHNLEEIAASAGKYQDACLMPRPIAHGRFLGQTFLLEPLVGGDSLDQLMARMTLTSFFPSICDYLANLCMRTQQKGGPWSEVLSDSARNYGLLLAEYYEHRGLSNSLFERQISEVADYLGRGAPRREGFRCAIHGDFWHGNILFDASQLRITAVLDWDHFEKRALPFLDLFNLIVKHEQYFNRKGLGQSVVALHKALGAGSPAIAPLRGYAMRIGVEERMISDFLVVYWIRQSLLLLKVDGPHTTAVIEEAIGEPLRYFHALAETASR